jgi:hypothetical protein
MAYIGREPLGGEIILLNSIESQFNGVLTTFNLTRTVSGVTSAFYPVSSEQLLVSLGGVIQKPDTTGTVGFKIAFNQIIFATPPPTSTSCFIVAYGHISDIGAPGNNTVSEDKLVNGSVTPVKLSTGGIYWDTSGNVGIGTTSLSSLFHLLSTNAAIRVTTTRSGNTYGNSAILFDSPRSTTSDGDTQGGRGLLSCLGNSTSTAGIVWLQAGSASLQPTQTDSQLKSNQCGIRLDSGGNFEHWANNNARLVVNSSGNVGIGTTNPSTLLHIAGITRIGANNTSSAELQIGEGATGNRFAIIDLVGDTTYTDFGFRLLRGNTGANADSSIIHKGTGKLNIQSVEAGTIEFLNSNTTRFRVDALGKVVIGSIDSGYLSPTGLNPVLQLNSNSSSTTSSSFGIFANSTASSPGIFLCRNRNTTSNNFIEGTVQTGDLLGQISFFGVDGQETPVMRDGATIRATCSSTPSGARMPTNLSFLMGSAVSSSAIESVIINSTGILVNGSIQESTDGGTTYFNVVTQQDIGYEQNKIPLNQYLGRLAFVDKVGDISTTSTPPLNNLDINFEYVSNTSIKIRMKGTDGVVRSTTLTLS